MNKKTRLVPLVLAVLAIAVAGCGGGDSSADPGSTPAGLASPGSVVYVEGNLRPSGELKSNVDAVAQSIAGVGNLGDYVVSKLEGSSKSGGETADFATEIDPWLGDRAGVAFSRLIDGELSEPLIAAETTNANATQQFIDKQAQRGEEPFENGSYEGIDFKVGGTEGNAIGVVGEWLVIADGERDFKAAVDASEGDSLAGEDRFQAAIAAASEGSLADVYVDVGALLEQSDDKIDPQAREALQGSGVDPSEATAVASVIPGSEEIEVDLSSDLGGEEAPSGDVSELLGSLPADSFAAFATSGFGDQLQEAIDNLDKEGIPPDLPPNQLKSGLSSAGVDLDKIASSLEDAAVFATGSDRDSLSGAMVLTSSDFEAAEAVSDLGTLLRGANVPGVTAVSGEGTGFSVRGANLGRKPIAVVAKGRRIAIGYGVPAAIEGLARGGPTLAGSPTYKAAVASLGNMPISAYADGPGALALAEALVPRSEDDFWEARRYLKEIDLLALGNGNDGELATAKLIVGLGK